MASPTKSIKRGNWFEEDALEAATGIRYYPDPKDKIAASLMTNPRTIVHSERIEPKDYKSTMSMTMIDPYKHTDYIKRGSNKGPRQQMLEAKMKRDIEDEFNAKQSHDYAESRKINYKSLAAESFRVEGFDKPSLIVNDPSIRVPTVTTDYSADFPVTFYSHELKKGSSCNFPMSFVRSTNPFRRSHGFSADIRTSTGKVGETYERPTRMPISRDYAILQNMVVRIRNELSLALGSVRIPGSAIAVVLAVIYDLGERSQGKCTVQDLAEEFASKLQVVLSSAELDAISVMYPAPIANDEKIVEILVYEVANIFRPSLSPRRLELVELAFNVCDVKELYVVSEEEIRAQFNGDAFKYFIGSDASMSGDEATDRFLQSVQLYLCSEKGGMDVNDFIDYYSCVSAEISSDNEFERLLKTQWFSTGN